MLSPADDDDDDEGTTIVRELGIAAGVMSELAAVDPFDMADRIATQLRSDGVALYDHDVNVVRSAVIETCNVIMQSVALAIMMED